MKELLIDTLKKRIMIFDGAMGTMIQKYHLQEEVSFLRNIVELIKTLLT